MPERFMISRTLTPSQRFPKRDQRVTQWKSEKTLTLGSFWSSSQVKDKGFSTSPPISSFHVPLGTSGTSLACSTGHFRVRLCPGGIRFCRKVSGLIITPPPIAPASGGAPS